MAGEEKGALPGTDGVQKSLDTLMNKIVDAFTANVDPQKISNMV